MQTHKNPELRKTGPVPGKPSSALSGPKPFQPAKPMAAKAPVAVKKPPVLELQGKKWIVVSFIGVNLLFHFFSVFLPIRPCLTR